MPVTAVVGAQWGDEAKGKMVDMLSEKAKYAVRYSGGDNAGHTVVNPFGEFKLKLMPCGVFYKDTMSVIGNGVVLNPETLFTEMKDLNDRGIDTSRLLISDRTNIIMPYHILLDGLEEESRGDRAIGTMHKGIGPAYTDKVTRIGIRAGDLLDKKEFLAKLTAVLEYKNTLITKVYNAEPLSLDDIYEQYCEYGERMKPYICDTTRVLADAAARNEAILLEGAQGFLLDPDFGTYPYATSSSPVAAGACLGSGISPSKLTHVIGVFKSYQTRVGAGPMPTELRDETGNKIREWANEYGTVSGRPRRCGWFDTVAARYSNRVNGFTSLAITRIDVLDKLPLLKICTGYELNGETTDNFPASIPRLEKCQPVYEEMPGWEKDTSTARKFEDLPPKAQKYIRRLEEIIGCPASIISVGRSREETIQTMPVFQG
jgi:adenylosuccinate synthase